jgi:hypothetical protein
MSGIWHGILLALAVSLPLWLLLATLIWVVL